MSNITEEVIPHLSNISLMFKVVAIISIILIFILLIYAIYTSVT